MIKLAVLLRDVERQSHDGSVGPIFDIGTIQKMELKVLIRGLQGALDFEKGE